MLNTVIFFACIIAAIVIGSRLKVNMGLVALVMAFLVGGFRADLSSSKVIANFPVALFFNFFLSCYLFGFAAENGTLKRLADHMLYRCRRTGWMIGLLFFLVTAVIAMLGAGGSAPFFTSPLCFSLALEAGINPLLVSLALWTGSMVGGATPWNSTFAMNTGMLDIYVSEEVAEHYVYSYFNYKIVLYTVMYLVFFLVLRGWKGKAESLHVSQPEPFDRRQQNTLKIIALIIAGIMVTSILQLMPLPTVIEDICGYLTFQLLASVGIIANILMKTADNKKVLQEKVPWDTLIMLSTMGIYMGLANNLGVAEYLTNLLANSVPAVFILPGMVLIMGVLSFFVSGAVVVPIVLPLLSSLEAISGVPGAAIYTACQIGLTASSISPFSQGGASVLTGCSDEAVRGRLIRQQIYLSVIITIVIVAIAMAGGFQMIH